MNDAPPIAIPEAPACPAYLEPFTWVDGDVTLECFVDYFAPDESVGYTGGAQLCHAYHAGVDLLCYLDDGIIEMIERRACSHLSGY